VHHKLCLWLVLKPKFASFQSYFGAYVLQMEQKTENYAAWKKRNMTFAQIHLASRSTVELFLQVEHRTQTLRKQNYNLESMWHNCKFAVVHQIVAIVFKLFVNCMFVQFGQLKISCCNWNEKCKNIFRRNVSVQNKKSWAFLIQCQQRNTFSKKNIMPILACKV